MNDNMRLYNSHRAVPVEAQKSIAAGRLKGMTDINPMWRIKSLTEMFGPVGEGWSVNVVDRWRETTERETAVFVMVELRYKENGEWSAPVTGIGGAMIVSVEKRGKPEEYIFLNDEAYKMAYTDAISVACKALGIAADVYFASDASFGSKYGKTKTVEAVVEELKASGTQDLDKPNAKIRTEDLCCEDCGTPFVPCTIGDKQLSAWDCYKNAEKIRGRPICAKCHAKARLAGTTK